MYTNMNNFVSKLLRYIERKQFEEKPSFFFLSWAGRGFSLMFYSFRNSRNFYDN